MELAAWFLTFATAAALLYAITRALAVALRIAIAVLFVAALAVGIQAYQRGEKPERITSSLAKGAKQVEGTATAVWNTVRPWWDSINGDGASKPHRRR